MNTKFLLFVFLLLTVNHINAAAHKFFIVEKDFLQVEKIVKQYLSTNDYEVKKTDDKILEIYFDTPELLYLKQNGYVRFKAVEYLSKKKKKVKYHENIEYSSDKNTSSRCSVKHYKSVKTFEEKHPLLSLVKRKEREDFLNKLKSDGIKYPMRLKEIVEVSKISHTFELNINKMKIGSISINQMRASAFDSETEFVMLGIISNNDTLIDEMKKVLKIKDIKIKDTEYTLAFEQMEKNVGLFYWILRYPYLVNLLYAVGFSIFGLLIILVFFRKRLRS